MCSALAPLPSACALRPLGGALRCVSGLLAASRSAPRRPWRRWPLRAARPPSAPLGSLRGSLRPIGWPPAPLAAGVGAPPGPAAAAAWGPVRAGLRLGPACGPVLAGLAPRLLSLAAPCGGAALLPPVGCAPAASGRVPPRPAPSGGPPFGGGRRRCVPPGGGWGRRCRPFFPPPPPSEHFFPSAAQLSAAGAGGPCHTSPSPSRVRPSRPAWEGAALDGLGLVRQSVGKAAQFRPPRMGHLLFWCLSNSYICAILMGQGSPTRRHSGALMSTTGGTFFTQLHPRTPPRPSTPPGREGSARERGYCVSPTSALRYFFSELLFGDLFFTRPG